MLWEFSFLFRFVFPHEIIKTIGTTYLTKKIGKAFSVVVYDGITVYNANVFYGKVCCEVDKTNLRKTSQQIIQVL
jgi:hypothetical protein